MPLLMLYVSTLVPSLCHKSAVCYSVDIPGMEDTRVQGHGGHTCPRTWRTHVSKDMEDTRVQGHGGHTCPRTWRTHVSKGMEDTRVQRAFSRQHITEHRYSTYFTVSHALGSNIGRHISITRQPSHIYP